MSICSDEYLRQLYVLKDATKNACKIAKAAIGRNGGSICKTLDYIMGLMIFKCKSQAAWCSRSKIAEDTGLSLLTVARHVSIFFAWRLFHRDCTWSSREARIHLKAMYDYELPLKFKFKHQNFYLIDWSCPIWHGEFTDAHKLAIEKVVRVGWYKRPPKPQELTPRSI